MDSYDTVVGAVTEGCVQCYWSIEEKQINSLLMRVGTRRWLGSSTKDGCLNLALVFRKGSG